MIWFLLITQMVAFGSKDLTLSMKPMSGTVSPFKFLWCLIPIMTQVKAALPNSSDKLAQHPCPIMRVRSSSCLSDFTVVFLDPILIVPIYVPLPGTTCRAGNNDRHDKDLGDIHFRVLWLILFASGETLHGRAGGLVMSWEHLAFLYRTQIQFQTPHGGSQPS